MEDPRLTDLETAVGLLFQRCPALCGFAVHEMRNSPREVVFDDVAIHPWAGHAPSARLLGEIAAALIELAEERPEAREMLAGRTFASAIH